MKDKERVLDKRGTLIGSICVGNSVWIEYFNNILKY